MSVNQSTTYKCPDGYQRVNGVCQLQFNCDSTKDKNCPPPTCDPIKKTCPPPSTYCKFIPSSKDCSQKPSNNNDNKDSPSTDTVIKYYITNPIIQQQITHPC